MKRRAFLGAAVAAAGTLGACDNSGPSAPAVSKERITWRMVTTWPRNFPGLGTGAQRLADFITEASGGRLTIKLYAARELVPAFEALFRRQGGSGREAWTHFYDAVRHLAALPDGQRLAALARKTPATPENRPETELDRPNAEPAP